MKLKKVIAIVLTLVMVLSLSACGNSGQDANAKQESNEEVKETKKVLKYGWQLDVVTNLDIHLFTNSEIFEVTDQTHEALIGMDPDTYELYPLLVKEMPKVSEDGKTYSFELKEGIKFHDGSELTSHDVKYTLERIFTPETGNVNTWICDMIQGSKEMLEGQTKELSGFNLIDDYKFEISIYEPFSAFDAVMATTQMVIFPEEAKDHGNDWGLNTYIGTGPFKIKEFEPKVKVVLDRFEDYHREVAKLDGIEILNMEANTALLEFEKGNIHVTRVFDSHAQQFKDDDKLKGNLKEKELLGIIALTLNHEKPPLDDVRVRKAISLAIDRKTLCENYLDGNAAPAKSMLPPGVPGYDPNAPELEYNPEKAKQLLVEAGYADGFEVESMVPENHKLVGVFTVLQAQLKEVGIKLNIQPVDKPSYIEYRKRGEIQMPILTWYADYVDPDNFLYTFLHGKNGTFFSSNYKNKEFDKLAEEGRLITDRDAKHEFYAKLDHKVVHEDLPHAPLYNPKVFYFQSDEVVNLKMQNSTFKFYSTDLN